MNEISAPHTDTGLEQTPDADVSAFGLPLVQSSVMPELENLGNISQADAMRMQAILDRVCKIETMLSNVLAAQAQTNNYIIRNLK